MDNANGRDHFVFADESQAGDLEMAKRRMELIARIPAREMQPETLELARKLITKRRLPAKAGNDARHVAIAAVSAREYLLTWNMRHIANSFVKKGIDNLCRHAGLDPPVICTPDALLGEDYDVER